MSPLGLLLSPCLLWVIVGLLLSPCLLWVRLGLLLSPCLLWVRVGLLLSPFLLWVRVGLLLSPCPVSARTVPLQGSCMTTPRRTTAPSTWPGCATCSPPSPSSWSRWPGAGRSRRPPGLGRHPTSRVAAMCPTTGSSRRERTSPRASLCGRIRQSCLATWSFWSGSPPGRSNFKRPSPTDVRWRFRTSSLRRETAGLGAGLSFFTKGRVCRGG